MSHKRQTPVEVTLPSSGVFVFESHHGSAFRMPLSSHPFLEIFFVLSGAGRLHIGSHSFPCSSDTMFVVPPGAEHRVCDDTKTPLSLYVLCLSPAVYQLGMTSAEARSLVAGPVPVSPLLLPAIRGSMRQLLFEQTCQQPGHRFHLLGLSLQLLGWLLRGTESRTPQPTHPPTNNMVAVQRYVEELKRNFLGMEDLDQVSSRLGMSRRSFTALFRKLTGTTWHCYVTQLRVEHAKRLLSETDHSIASVAFECGFEDLSSFYRVFRRHTSQSPLRYRSDNQSGKGA